jgi:hypothetical protein
LLYSIEKNSGDHPASYGFSYFIRIKRLERKADDFSASSSDVEEALSSYPIPL